MSEAPLKVVIRHGKVCAVDGRNRLIAVFDRYKDHRTNLIHAYQYVQPPNGPTGEGGSIDLMTNGDTPTPVDGLNPRQMAMREAFDQIEDRFGQWDQTPGSDGVNYLGAKDNPFIKTGIICENCTFYTPNNSTGLCEVVAGDIDPQGSCKLWIIPPDSIRARADDTTTTQAAGLALRAADTGRVLMLQRALDEDDPNGGTWEFPGGNMEDGENPLGTASREWMEEMGVPLPPLQVVASWTSGVYQGFVADVACEQDVPINLPMDQRPVPNPDDMSETSAWWDPADLADLSVLRNELIASRDQWLPLMRSDVANDGNDQDEATASIGNDPHQAIDPHSRPYNGDDTAYQTTASLHVAERTPPAPVTAPVAADATFVTHLNGKTIITARAPRLPQGSHLNINHWIAPPNPNKHMMWLQGRYVGAETPNRNGHLWTTADLQMGQPTVAHGPLNWLHEERRVIGAIADAKFIPGAGGDRAAAADTTDPHIATLSSVWTWLYPREAYAIRQAQDQGQLYQSMEAIAQGIGCAGPDGCGNSYPYDAFLAGATCDCLRQKGSVKRMINPTFLGSGVIVPPARPGWADADVRVMASAVQLAETSYEAAGRPDIPASTWEQMMAQIVRLAEGD